MIKVTKTVFIPELGESFYPGEIVKLDEKVEKRIVEAGRGETSQAKNEKRVTPEEGLKAQIAEEKLARKKGLAMRNENLGSKTVTEGTAKENNAKKGE